jgi:hypothetical protein
MHVTARRHSVMEKLCDIALRNKDTEYFLTVNWTHEASTGPSLFRRSCSTPIVHVNRWDPLFVHLVPCVNWRVYLKANCVRTGHTLLYIYVLLFIKQFHCGELVLEFIFAIYIRIYTYAFIHWFTLSCIYSLIYLFIQVVEFRNC